jgi:hypothetical protein
VLGGGVRGRRPAGPPPTRLGTRVGVLWFPPPGARHARFSLTGELVTRVAGSGAATY